MLFCKIHPPRIELRINLRPIILTLLFLAADGASAQTTVHFGTLRPITGIGDVDLSGSFTYAIDVGGPGRTVGGLSFDRDQDAAAAAANQDTPGTQMSPDTPGYYPCMNQATRGSNDPNLGDENLDELLQYMRNDSVPFRVIQLNVVPGTSYKLQVLALSSDNVDRRFDLSVGPDSGAANADNTWKANNVAVDSLMEQMPMLWTWQFTATTTSLWINCGKEDPQTGSDPNPCLSAITLEAFGPQIARFGALTTISDIGDIDLSGRFEYAVDIGGPGRTLNGLRFDRDEDVAAPNANQDAPGTQVSPDTPGFYPCMNDAFRGSNDPNLGDEQLDELLQYMRNDSVPFRVIQLDVTPGTRYKLQVLALSSSDVDRRFKLSVGPDSGATNADAVWVNNHLVVTSLLEQEPRLWSWNFTATANSLWINCGKEDPQTGDDPNPCLSAITLENLSQPLVIYPGPSGEPESTDYKVSVNGQPLFMYTSFQYDRDEWTQIMNHRPVSPVTFCSFDFGGAPVSIQVEVIAPELSKDFVVVKPLARRITPAISNGVFSFTLSDPGQITVQPGGTTSQPSLFKPLHIFANPVEIDPPSPGDPNVIYYGPGVHVVEQLQVGSGQTLYLSGGAVVRAAATGLEKPFVKVENANNVVIRGRGILCGRLRVQDQRPGAQEVRIIDIANSDQVTIEGLVLREPEGWTCMIHDGSDYATVDNVKIIAADASSDGFVLTGGSHSVVRNSFCHNSDDAYETKAWPPDATDILFENNIAWSTVASAFAHSAETEANVSNVRFRNCTVINASYNLSDRAPIGISVNGRWNISDYLFENITIEYIQASNTGTEEMPAIRVQNNQEAGFPPAPEVNYEEVNPDPGFQRPRGSIGNIIFRNIHVLNTVNEDVVVIADAESSPISNVHFENVVINGSCLVPGDARLHSNAWVANLTVQCDPMVEWLSSYGLSGVDALLTGDPDRDGVANFAEAGFGGNPILADRRNQALVPRSTTTPGGGEQLEFTFRRPLVWQALGFSYSFEISTDLANWSPATIAPGLITPATDGRSEWVTFRLEQSYPVAVYLRVAAHRLSPSMGRARGPR